jgi:hypothetical protein
MLSIPVKKSENPQISQHFLEYITRTQSSATASKLQPFLSFLEDHRLSFTTSTDSTTLEFKQSSLEFYLSALTSLETRIPLSSTPLAFLWTDSYSLSKTQKLGSYNLEKVAVMYTLAALYTRSAVSADLRSPNGHKFALNAYQISAGYLKQCKEQSLPSPYKDDLYKENFCIWEEVMVAQGYYTMFNKLDKKTANKDNLIKLAFAIYKNFESALGKIAGIPEFPVALRNLIRFWAVNFEALTEFYQGLAEKERILNTGKGFGPAVARIRMAERIIEGVEFNHGLPSEAVDLSKSFLAMIREERSKAEDENYAIYMDSIPENVSKTNVELIQLFQPKILELKKFQEQELINNLLPIELQALYQEYDSKMSEYLRAYNLEADKVGKSFKEIEGYTFSGIPNSLWTLISSQKNTELSRQIEILNGIRKSCGDELRISKERLMKEESEDDDLKRMYGKKWVRQPSCIANADLKLAIDALIKGVIGGFEQDEEIINVFSDKEKELIKLNQEKDTLDSLIPNLPASQESEKSSIFRKLQDSTSSLEKSIETFSTAIRQPSIYELLKSYHIQGKSSDSIITIINDQFSSLHSSITTNLKSCQSDLSSYSTILLPLTVDHRASQTISSLSSLLSTKQSISSQLSTRLSHYSSLFASVQELVLSIDTLLSKREFEKQEILGRLSSKTN